MTLVAESYDFVHEALGQRTTFGCEPGLCRPISGCDSQYCCFADITQPRHLGSRLSLRQDIHRTASG